MDRRLPPQYEGWQQHETAARRMTTPDLIDEVQDGPPERRLAALSVIDLAEVSLEMIEDWIRTLPDPEANELAGAIPAQRPHTSVSEDLRWVEVARLGYEQRRLPTFLVMLFSSLEAVEAKDAIEGLRAWEQTAAWLASVYDRLVAGQDTESLDDVSLFVFENYLDREPLFEAFCGLVEHHQSLAMQLSLNPHQLLGGLSLEKQKVALEAAERGGGRPLRESWLTLHG